jgi:hypothetical protein
MPANRSAQRDILETVFVNIDAFVRLLLFVEFSGAFLMTRRRGRIRSERVVARGSFELFIGLFSSVSSRETVVCSLHRGIRAADYGKPGRATTRVEWEPGFIERILAKAASPLISPILSIAV